MKTRFISSSLTPHFPTLLTLILLSAAFLLCSPGSSRGAPVGEKQVRAAVQGWLNADPKPMNQWLGHDLGEVEAFTNETGLVNYFIVYLDPAGFVIVPADDLVEPILGFAPAGRYDPSAVNPLGALVSQDTADRLAMARGAGTAAPPKALLAAQQKWTWLESEGLNGPASLKGLQSVSDVRVAPLVQSRWNQQTDAGGTLACYNYYTPPFYNSPTNNANYPCGCVATAMAQVMRYFRFPASPVIQTTLHAYSFEHTYVSPGLPLMGGGGSSGEYVWTNMPYCPSNAPEGQRMEIGRLTFDAGLAAHMDYCPVVWGGSGASLTDAAKALTNAFFYPNAMVGGNGGANIGPNLTNMINPNLDAAFPVLLGLSQSQSGDEPHAVVCDGYGYQTNTLYHHLNLGWAGVYDAWYNLPTVDYTNNAGWRSVDCCIYNVFTNGAGEIISGRVTRWQGTTNVPLPGATVTAVLNNSTQSWTTTTGPAGIYALPQLPSSTNFNITVTRSMCSPTNGNASTGLSTWNTTTCGNRWGADFALMPTAPVIGTQPVSRTNLAGTTASFTFSASGFGPFGYQWNKGGVNLTNSSHILGATNITLSIAHVVKADEGSYSVVITNLGGSVTSSNASLTVLDPPVIVTQPVSVTNSTLCPLITFSVAASGAEPLSYQWRKDDISLSNSTNVSGADSTNLFLCNVPKSSEGTYTVVITNIYGCITSTPATLTLIDPPVITTQPLSRTNLAGTTATFAVVASGTEPLSYQWIKNATNCLADGGNFSGAATPTLTISNVLVGDEGVYSVVITNILGVTVTSVGASLTVIQTPSILTQPVSVTNIAPCPLITFSVEATGSAPLIYQWRKDNMNLSNTTNIAGADSATLSLSNASKSSEGTYTVTITNAYGCVTSAPATLTLIDSPVITTQPLSRTNLAGTVATFAVAASGTVPLDYQWIWNGTNYLADAGRVCGTKTNTLTITNVARADAGDYCVRITNTVGAVTSSIARLTVLEPPSILTQPASVTNVVGCSSVTFSVVVGGTEPLSYQWRKNNIGLSNSTNVSGADSATLTLYNVPKSSEGTYTVAVTNAYGSVTSAPATLTLADLPMITVQPVSRTNQADSTATFTVSAIGTAPLRYQWIWNGTNNMADFGRTSGTKTETLTIGNVLKADEGNYSVRITNSYGAVTSSVAKLTVVPEALAPMPLILLHLNEAAGTIAYDASTNHNDGTLHYCGWTTGVSGGALYLGGNDYVVVPHSASLDITNTFWVEAWIKAQGTANYLTILDKFNGGPVFNGFTLYVNSGLLRLSIYSGTHGSSDLWAGLTDLRDNQWHHVAAWWDGSYARGYVDGGKLAEVRWTNAPGSTTLPLCIGARYSSYPSSMPFLGTIDEVRVSRTPPLPGPLSAACSGTNIVISWAGFGSLQAATNVNGPYVTVTNAICPYTPAPAGSRMFYRLSSP
jgi:hypothetical protein